MGNKPSRPRVAQGKKRSYDEDDQRPKVQQLKNLAPPPLTSVPYEIDQFHDWNCKELVLQLLSDKTQKNRWMGELRVALFLAAASSNDPYSFLLPFPACCIIKETKSKDFDIILKAMEEVPELVSINENTIMDPLTWELLYWIFTNPLALEPLTEDIHNQIQEMRATTKLDLPVPDNVNTWMFNIKQTQPKPKFEEAKATVGSFYGYHGSRVPSFHSIIHRGLISSYCRYGLYGRGTYLAPRLDISKDTYYARVEKIWKRSAFGDNIQCVAVCEVIDSPSIRKVENFCYVCDNDELLQLSHLYVFKAEPQSEYWI